MVRGAVVLNNQPEPTAYFGLLLAAPNISDPVCDCSTLELISPDHWITLDGCVLSRTLRGTALGCLFSLKLTTHGSYITVSSLRQMNTSMTWPVSRLKPRVRRVAARISLLSAPPLIVEKTWQLRVLYVLPLRFCSCSPISPPILIIIFDPLFRLTFLRLSKS